MSNYQQRVFDLLAWHPMSISELAQALHVNREAIASAIARLQRRHVLERQCAEINGRSIVWSFAIKAGAQRPGDNRGDTVVSCGKAHRRC